MIATNMTGAKPKDGTPARTAPTAEDLGSATATEHLKHAQPATEMEASIGRQNDEMRDR